FTNGIQVANIDGPTAVYNEPLTVYFVVITTLLLMQIILKKKTPVDILLIPLTAVILATLSTFVYSAPLFAFIEAIKSFINTATTVAPLPMSIIIAVSMGMLLTSPLSSAAIAITIQLSGIAGGAAVVGTMIQMIGFSFQSRKDNSLGMVLSIGFGTSMLQFKNILRKPVIWIPTIVASAVLAPILVLLFKIETTAYGAGMGTAGLVGPLQTLFEMNYSINAFLSMVIILFGGVALVYVFDLLLRKLGLIVKGDFNVLNDIV
ncbi:MAG: PTS sugar transporter subunit IIC, partial [Acholeplasmataceae bacterium]